MKTRKHVILSCENFSDKQQIFEKIEKIDYCKIQEFKIDPQNQNVKIYLDIDLEKEKYVDQKFAEVFGKTLISAKRGF